MKKLVIKDNPTIRKKVYNYVREQILSGEVGPNERLIENKIAKEIGTSRTPVREALHSLEIEGLIESIPRVGYMVKTLSDQEAVELWEIRCLIEGLAARWAVEKAHDKLVRELRKNIALAEERVAQGDVAAFVELDGQFHEIIARLSGGTRLLELSQMLRRHALRYRLHSINTPDTAFRAIEGHKAILKAIEAGDPEQISLTIKSHLEQSKEDTLRYAFKEDQRR
jgi:GntR family transcriptional regulator, rspAB operon transcriptional repressor